MDVLEKIKLFRQNHYKKEAANVSSPTQSPKEEKNPEISIESFTAYTCVIIQVLKHGLHIMFRKDIFNEIKENNEAFGNRIEKTDKNIESLLKILAEKKS